MHVREAIRLINPGGREDEAGGIPGVDDIRDREAAAAQELPDRQTLAAEHSPGIYEHALNGVDLVFLAQGGNAVALRRIPGVHQTSTSLSNQVALDT